MMTKNLSRPLALLGLLFMAYSCSNTPNDKAEKDFTERESLDWFEGHLNLRHYPETTVELCGLKGVYLLDFEKRVEISNYKDKGMLFVKILGDFDTITVDPEGKQIELYRLSADSMVVLGPLDKSNDCNGLLDRVKNTEIKDGPRTYFIENRAYGPGKASITTTGFERSNDTFYKQLTGSVTRLELADLNNDGFKEIYVFYDTDDPNEPGIWALASNRNKSVSEINLRLKTAPDCEERRSFVLQNNKLYSQCTDANNTGKIDSSSTRFEYRLKMGEATWVLEEMN